MNTDWQTESGSLECRWSELTERSRYIPAWFHDAAPETYASVLPPIPDFAAHSPLGSGEWMVPWNARWCLPTR